MYQWGPARDILIMWLSCILCFVYLILNGNMFDYFIPLFHFWWFDFWGRGIFNYAIPWPPLWGPYPVTNAIWSILCDKQRNFVQINIFIAAQDLLVTMTTVMQSFVCLSHYMTVLVECWSWPNYVILEIEPSVQVQDSVY